MIWTYRTARQTAGWEVHSSLVASAEVTCLDFHSGEPSSMRDMFSTDEGQDLSYWAREKV